eukprot:TRINITY_DN3474_c0_g3_i1.p1 TRINITY_DN3474_c0_g3~~TRINITY_DN3474_c0_g3_i1.p1  ORF type:complete len:384 (-),score=70.46 TRINITY_DN3474_c0_g3_i1:287-1438(-)
MAQGCCSATRRGSATDWRALPAGILLVAVSVIAGLLLSDASFLSNRGSCAATDEFRAKVESRCGVKIVDSCGGLEQYQAHYLLSCSTLSDVLLTFWYIVWIVVLHFKLAERDACVCASAFGPERGHLRQMILATLYCSVAAIHQEGLPVMLVSCLLQYTLATCVLFINAPFPSTARQTRSAAVALATSAGCLPAFFLNSDNTNDAKALVVGYLIRTAVTLGLCVAVCCESGLPALPSVAMLRAAARDMLPAALPGYSRAAAPRHGEAALREAPQAAGALSLCMMTVLAALMLLVAIQFAVYPDSAMTGSEILSECPSYLGEASFYRITCSIIWLNFFWNLTFAPVLLMDSSLHKLTWESTSRPLALALTLTLAWQAAHGQGVW